MDRRTVRALAAGMILGALGMFSIAFYTSEEEVTASNEEASSSADQSSDDTVTLTKEEYNSLQTQIKEWEKRVIDLSTAQENAEGQAASDQDENASNENSEVTRLILTIESGMTAPEIGEILAQYDVVSDPLALNDYLEAQQLTDGIQIGRYDIDSTLSIEEIAQLITR